MALLDFGPGLTDHALEHIGLKMMRDGVVQYAEFLYPLHRLRVAGSSTHGTGAPMSSEQLQEASWPSVLSNIPRWEKPAADEFLSCIAPPPATGSIPRTAPR